MSEEKRDAAKDLDFLDLKVNYATMEHIEALRKIARKYIQRATQAEAERDAWRELAYAFYKLWLTNDEHDLWEQEYEAAMKKRDVAWERLKELGVKIDG